jgi:5-methylcytosine-specific restriction endonuclease McrA
MHASVLLLNADGQPLSLLPLSTIPWQNAVKAMYGNKVHVIKNYKDRFLRSTTVSIPLPSVIMMNTYHKHPSQAKFTRRNLYIRDEYKCQYCSKQFFFNELTIDHVIPKSKGGRLTWDNSVTACGPCNVKKADKLTMRPVTSPYRPSWFKINGASKHHTLHIPDEAWQDYINWPEDKLIVAENVTLD